MRSSIRLIYQILCILMPYITNTTSTKNAQQIDYQGVLTTLNQHDFPVSQVSIAGRKECIPVYTAPCNTNAIITCLAFNPEDTIAYLNLADIKEIEVPYPYATWIYKSPKCRGKKKYLLINVIWNDLQRTATHYLIEPKRRINSFIQRSTTKTISTIPFSGFKKCTIQAMSR